jgi:hypothetical protein
VIARIVVPDPYLCTVVKSRICCGWTVGTGCSSSICAWVWKSEATGAGTGVPRAVEGYSGFQHALSRLFRIVLAHAKLIVRLFNEVPLNIELVAVPR